MAYVEVLACCFQIFNQSSQVFVLENLVCVGGQAWEGLRTEVRTAVSASYPDVPVRISLAARTGRSSDVAALEKRLRQPLMASADDGAAHTFQG